MIPALVLGTVLAVGALAYVLYPILMGTRLKRQSTEAPASPDLAVAALREIEFDRATGKLSDADYTSLRARYVAPALAELDRANHPVPATDPLDEAVSRYRASHGECPTCGPRREPDAAYCADCGRYLGGACDGCRQPVEAPGATFCPSCGKRLAA